MKIDISTAGTRFIGTLSDDHDNLLTVTAPNEQTVSYLIGMAMSVHMQMIWRAALDEPEKREYDA